MALQTECFQMQTPNRVVEENSQNALRTEAAKRNMAPGAGKEAHKWTPEQTRQLITFRAENEEQFTKKKYAAKQLWGTLIKQLSLEGKVTPQQVSKKWENLKKKYKELKTPKTGSGTENGEVTAATWQFYADMHEVLGARPSIEPPVLVASFVANTDATTLLMNIIEPPIQTNLTEPEQSSESASIPEQSTASTSSPGESTASTSSASASTPSTRAALPRAAPDPTTPSPKKKKRKTNPVLDFLKQESQNEQKRHEQSEAKTERFLGLFEKMIDKLPNH